MTAEAEPRFQTAGTETETVVKFRLEPINPRKRIVLKDTQGATFKISYIQIRIKLSTAFEPRGSAGFHGIRINPETGAHLETQVKYFDPDPKLLPPFREEIEQFIKDKLRGHTS